MKAIIMDRTELGRLLDRASEPSSNIVTAEAWALEKKRDFGLAVKRERRRLALSQEALAERACLHRTYITDIERGARNISLETMCRLAVALQVSIETLLVPVGAPAVSIPAHPATRLEPHPAGLPHISGQTPGVRPSPRASL